MATNSMSKVADSQSTLPAPAGHGSQIGAITIGLAAVEPMNLRSAKMTSANSNDPLLLAFCPIYQYH